jgi:hypothetical protein
VLAAQFVLGILRGLSDENFVSDHQSSTLALFELTTASTKISTTVGA